MRILLLCSVALALSGCWSAPKINALSDAGSWAIPVTAAKVVQDAQDAVHGTGQNQPDMVITVPASDMPTVVEVRKVKRTIMDKALTNKPVFYVKSDNQGVTAAQPKQAVWWRWIVAFAVGLFLVAAILMAVVQRVANVSPWGFLLKLFRRG